MSIKDLITEYQQLKAKRAELSQADAELEQRMDDIEAAMLVELDNAGTDSVSVNGLGTVYRKQEIVPTIEDYATALNYIRDNDLMFLFQRRLNATAYRELLEQGVEVEGINPTQITKIIFRKK
ncbi:hypothetical protein [Gallibacterium anatis]|uniref:Host-nuclease inhibitor protein Gam n=1 Tax=Gallibacterium anatis 4895 TaxID=1396510 RepID=A0A0A2ZWC1_9PAST|nr:hypothetical protein [Gallibacterium anatis]KGQ59707.1 hypothetical protein IO48_10770 [Gallibacterium anatis 4895]